MSPPGTLSIASQPSTIDVSISEVMVVFSSNAPVGTKGTIVFNHSLGFTFEINFEVV